MTEVAAADDGREVASGFAIFLTFSSSSSFFFLMKTMDDGGRICVWGMVDGQESSA